MRVFAVFKKGEPQRYISHLDVLRTVQRALRRAGIPVAYSAGYNPHPVLSFASALSVGITGRAEVFDVRVEPMDERDFYTRLAPHMPPGMTLTGAHAVADDYPSAMALVAAADYSIRIAADGERDAPRVAERLDGWQAVPMKAQKKSKSGLKEIDLRDGLYGLTYEADAGVFNVRVRCAVSNSGALNPRLLLPFITEGLSGAECDIERLALWARQREAFVQLWEL